MDYQYHRDKLEYFHIGRCNCSAHFHRSIELIYCIKTPKPITIDGRSFFLKEGELLIVPPFHPHRFPYLEDHRSVCIVMPVSYSDIFDRRTEGKRLAEYVLKDKKLTNDLYAHFLQLENCQDALLKQGIYTYVLAKILQNANLTNIEKQENTDFSVHVLQYIEQHYAENITQEILAASFGYNRNYFSALFKKHIHTGFSAYLNVVRINKAISLLGNHPVAEVAEAVGFRNVQSFYSNFKKVTGTSPAEYLRTAKK